MITSLPQDVVELVIAAREAFDTGFLPAEEQGALDVALERFSARVPYANDCPGLARATLSQGTSNE